MKYRLESSFRSFSRPVLHAAARVVQEMGKSRAAAHALGVYDEGARLHSYSESVDSIDTSDLESSQSEGAPPIIFVHYYSFFAKIKYSLPISKNC